MLEGLEPTWSGTGLQYPEAPHLFERHGTWYLLIAEGDTERGHAVSIARGPSPAGPWQPCPGNPIIQLDTFWNRALGGFRDVTNKETEEKQ